VHVRPVVGGVEVLAPAKLNLLLEVIARRCDSYHEIVTLMVPIRIYDTLTFRAAPFHKTDFLATSREDATCQKLAFRDPALSSGAEERLELACEWAIGLRTQPPRGKGSRLSAASELGDLPEGNDNIALRAVELLRARAGIARGACLRLVKRIPSAAGLGGGSSDAAAALVAANRVWGLDWSTDQLRPLAAELGSDVPFFLGSGPAICRGRGERIEPIQVPRALHFVVVRPPEGLSTPAVYRACQIGAPPVEVDPLVRTLLRGDLRALAGSLHNRLQHPAEQLSPWVVRLKEEFARLNFLAAQMSGSGTSYFGVCHDARHAQTLAGRLRSRSLGYVFACRSA